MPATDLLSLQAAKDHLNMRSSANDAELQGWIDAVTELVELRCGPMSTKQFTQITSAGWVRAIALRQWPVVSVDSLVALTTSGPTYVATDFYVDDAGILRRLDGCNIYGPITITYTAGRTSVPLTVQAAAKVILQHFWETQRGAGNAPALGAAEMPTQMPGIYWDDIPNQAKVLLGPYLLGPSVA